MLYNMMYAMEINRLVHEERLAEAERNLLLRELALANRLELNSSPFAQIRKAMNRAMSLLF